MNRERELVLEDKNHDNSVENRNAIMIRATSLAYSAILLVAVLACYIGVNFFGFGAAANSWLFLIMIVGMLADIDDSLALLCDLYSLVHGIKLDRHEWEQNDAEQ